MKEKFNDIKNKIYTELDKEERSLVNEVLKLNSASQRQIDIIFMAFMFGETVEQSFKRAL